MAFVSGGQLEAEGFLCPLCMKDLTSPAQLEQHWKKAHPQEDNDVFRQLKGLFGKARKFLRIEDDGSVDGSSSSSNGGGATLSSDSQISGANSGFAMSFQEPQVLGQTRHHYEFFQKCRSARNDRFVMETNKLIVRLSKLLAPENAVADRVKRKEIEQRIVPWAPDEDFPLCMTCGNKFGLRRRRHHCRLCGGIMCDRCSHFLQLDFARHLTETHIVSTDAEREAHQQNTSRIRGKGFLQRRGSDSSLNSYATDDGGPHLRTCHECRHLLERRSEQVQQRQHKDVIVEMYEKMRTAMQDAARLVPEFEKMADSLSNGESTYSLDSAASRRAEIARLYDQVDNLSKRIVALDADDEEPTSQRRQALQKSIRAAATLHLRSHAYCLPHLPSADEYAGRRAAHDESAKRRAEAEVKAVVAASTAAAASVTSSTSPPRRQQRSAVTRPPTAAAAKPAESTSRPDGASSRSGGGEGGNGLTTASPAQGRRTAANPFLDDTPGVLSENRRQGNDSRLADRSSDPASGGRLAADGRNVSSAGASSDDVGSDDTDPLLMQIQRVKEYLSQAEAAQMWDEVGMLRANLSMLERQRRQEQEQQQQQQHERPAVAARRH